MKRFLLEKHFTHLFHISDVHILNGEERQQEFIKQFGRTEQAIAQHPHFHKNHSLIVVTGDLLDKGIKMSAIAIELLQLLVDSLTKLAPTIIIPGNHDDKKDVGLSTLDSLTAVFNQKMQTRNNLYYLKETGIYLFGDNIAFGHTSVIDKKLVKATDIQTSGRIKVALFHGMIDSSTNQTDNNFLLHDCDFHIKDFDGYDKVLLGDVHKAHSVGNDHRIWYAGSLVQKSFAEDRRQHGGLLVWDIYSQPNCQPQYIHIKNDHAFLVLKVEKGQIVGELTETSGSLHLRDLKPFRTDSLPERSSIRFKCDNQTQHCHLDTLTQQLETKTKIIKNNRIWTQITPQQKQTNPEINENENEKSIETFLKLHYPDDKDELLTLHQKLSQDKLADEVKQCYGKWNINHITIENVYNYQKKHHINFQKLPNGIISITGKNGTGKSKIIDSILLAIYGCGPKLVTHVISHGLNKANTTINISVNGDLYLIKRTFTRGKKINKTTLAITKNGVDETATDKPQNEKAIIRLFGMKDDLCDTHISLQGHHQAFIHKKEKEQRELLKRIFHTNEYENLEKMVKAEITNRKKILSQDRQTLTKFPENNLETLQNTLLTLTLKTPQIKLEKDQLIQKLRDNDLNRLTLTTLRKNKVTLTKDREKLTSKLITIPYSTSEINTKQLHTQEKLGQLEKNRADLQTDIDKHREQKHPLNQTLLEDIQNLENQLQVTQKENSCYQTDLDKLVKKKELTHNRLEKVLQMIKQITDDKYKLLSQTDNQRKWTLATTTLYQEKLAEIKRQLDKPSQEEDRQLKRLEKSILLFESENKGLDENKIQEQYREYQEITLKHKLVLTKIDSLKDTLEETKRFLENDTFTYNDCCPNCQHNKKINLIPEKIKQQMDYQEQLNEQITTSKAYQTYLAKHQKIPSLSQQFDQYRADLFTKSKLGQSHNQYLNQHQKYLTLQEEAESFKKHQKDTQGLKKLVNELETLELDRDSLKKELAEEAEDIQDLQQKLQTSQLALAAKRQQMEAFIQAKKHLQNNQQLESEIEQFNLQISKIDKQRQSLHQTLDRLRQMEKDLLDNTVIERQLLTLSQQIEELEKELTPLEMLVEDPQQLEEKLQAQEETLNTHLKKIQEVENDDERAKETERQRKILTDNIEIGDDELKLHQTYLKITQDYPIYLNQQGIISLETIINQYLWNMTRFTINILDDSQQLTFLKVDGKQQIPIDYCSGFEKFAISIAIRIALAKIHPFNSMNSLIIDEGFGVFDSENLKRLPEMLEPLTQTFQKIFIITHIDELQSELRQKMTVTNDRNGFPTIH